jgi:hypothetical protein
MESTKSKQAKIDAALVRLADMIQSGNLITGEDTVKFLDTVSAELKDLRKLTPDETEGAVEILIEKLLEG